MIPFQGMFTAEYAGKAEVNPERVFSASSALSAVNGIWNFPGP